MIMNLFVPQNYIIRTGIGHSSNKLAAFDCALINAGVSDYNLIKVSSILPSECANQKNISLPKGSLLPSAFASNFSNDIGSIISSAVAIGIPKNSKNIGVIMECSNNGGKMETEKIVRELAEQAMINRAIEIDRIESASIECVVNSSEIYCTFATVSMW